MIDRLTQDDGLASFGGAFWSFAALASGDIGHARELAERAMAEAPTDYFRGWAAAFLAGALTRGGNVIEALPILEQAVALARRSAHFSGYLLIALVLAEARLTAGQIGAARALLKQLRSEAHGYACVAGGCEQLLGEIALAHGQHRGALDHFDAAHALFEAWCR